MVVVLVLEVRLALLACQISRPSPQEDSTCKKSLLSFLVTVCGFGVGRLHEEVVFLEFITTLNVSR